VEDKLGKIQESLLALCNTQTIMCDDQKKLAADRRLSLSRFKVDSLFGTVHDIDQQTHAHKIPKMENGDHPGAPVTLALARMASCHPLACRCCPATTQSSRAMMARLPLDP